VLLMNSTASSWWVGVFFLGKVITGKGVVSVGAGVVVCPVNFSFYVGREIVGGTVGDRDKSVVVGDVLA
jgi:hypothetical protein